MDPPSSQQFEIPSIDELFLERPFASRWQLLTIALISLGALLTGCFVTSPIFYRFNVPYTCSQYSEDTGNVSLLLSEISELDKCDPRCIKWSFNYTTLDRETSIQESFNLVCENEIYLKIHGSLYFLALCCGSALGGFMSDKIGRQKWFSFAAFMATFACVSLALSKSLLLHFVSWFLNGAFLMSAYVGKFTLSAEVARSNSRHIWSMILNFFSAVSIILCAPLAYAFQDWRHLVLAISFLSFLGAFVLLFIDESPRWQWSQSRYSEAAATIGKAYRLSNTNVPTETQNKLSKISENFEQQKHGFFSAIKLSFQRIFGKAPRQIKTESIFRIYKHPRLLFRLSFLAIQWTCANALYYGLSFGAEMFQQNVYIFVMTQGVACVVGNILGFFLMNSFGRKTIGAITLLFAGVCYYACGFISLSNTGIILTISFAAKISLEIYFMICYIWTSDLMPTVIRTSAIGTASLTARILGLALPFVENLGKFNESYPFMFFGSLALVTVICSLFLPESKGEKLPGTMEEGNSFAVRNKTSPNGLNCETEVT